MSEDKVTLKEVRIQKTEDHKEILTLWFTNNLMLCMPDLKGMSISDLKIGFNAGIDRLAADSRIKA